MHEHNVTENLLQTALAQADLRAGERIQRLHIALDPNGGYAPDAIRFYFEHLAQGTRAFGAELAFSLAPQPQAIRLTAIDIDDSPASAEDVESSNNKRMPEEVARWAIAVQGVVQGVGFRPFVFTLANQLGLSGWVRNTSTGVQLEVQGKMADLEHFCHHLQHDAPPLARIIGLDISTVEPELDASGFRILSSESQDGRTLISPDVAMCAACRAELHDPLDQRYQYPFINCTHCGPRFTIMTGLPYDRPNTTMRDFPLCPTCAAEYAQPTNRRFHAQPIACAACGPHIWYQSGGQSGSFGDLGHDAGANAIAQASECLRRDGIIALKGLGGFHLACRADSSTAIQRLRLQKQRPAKPLAIMVRTVAEARHYVEINTLEEKLLNSPEAPIVLLRKRAEPGAAAPAIAPEIAPDNGYIGVMLPYTPLHELLLAQMNAPLLMTSGNPTGEPLCIDNAEATAQLAFADGFLLHNRPIARRCDDSVVFAARQGAGDATQWVRRSRGMAPLPVLLPAAITLAQPLVAAGADLKNTSAVAVGQNVFLTQHIGNLSSPNVRLEQTRALADFEKLFQIQTQVAACDLHPDYASSRYARRRASQEKWPLFEVQHHHAHIAACLAEHNHLEHAIGLAFDGTGYGADGHIWGGEALHANLANFERVCHLEYLPLPGGDAAIRHPWRIALAYLRTLLPHVDARSLLRLTPAQADPLDVMLRAQFNTPLTSSMGRLFDAVSALLGFCAAATYEGQAAIALENETLGSQYAGRGYPFAITDGQVRLGSLFAALAADIQSGQNRTDMARRFHITVAEMAVEMARYASTCAADVAPNVVALSGGVWQNRLLLELSLPRLEQAGFQVLLPRAVPANDGGIAYGQAVVAAARLSNFFGGGSY